MDEVHRGLSRCVCFWLLFVGQTARGYSTTSCTGTTYDDCVLSFTASGSFTLNSATRAHILIVGAGGSGGTNAGGGGGAGELVFGPNVALPAGSYSVAVGGETAGKEDTDCAAGNTGADSSITLSGDSMVAKGGGGGNSGNGGSGGGGSTMSFLGTAVGGLALTTPYGATKTAGFLTGFRSYGNNGGTATRCIDGLGLTAGGGGAGGAGVQGSDSAGGNGGAGLGSVTIASTVFAFVSIFGTGFGAVSGADRVFAGGGGGGKWTGLTGTCSGAPYTTTAGETLGNGGTGGGGGGQGSIHGTANTGGGGAGGLDRCSQSGKGGSGIVLIAFDEIICPSGRYKSSGTCTACPAGTYGPDGGQTSIARCLSCPAGKFGAASGLVQCTNCSAGTATALTGQTQCSNCLAGTIAASPGLSVCSNCLAGTIAASPGLSVCSNCLAGTIAASTGPGGVTSTWPVF
jgi:hypothetical protein